jgi:ABC-type transport system involved in multi-copper enzyme maturation permease subunit
MHAIFPIALNTFREARRNRVLYTTLFFGVALIGLSVIFTEVTFVAHDRILRDFSFATMNIFALGLAVFLGIGMVNREIEKKTIYTVVSKPVPRWAFIVGKWLGLLLTMVVTSSLMFGGFLLVLVSYRSPLSSLLFVPWLTLMVEVMVVIAFAIFCSTWTSSLLSAVFALGMVVIGHSVRDIRLFGSQSDEPMVRRASSWVYHALPDLERFNFKSTVALLEPVQAGDVGFAIGYGLLWSAAFLFAAILVFQRRDFR